MHLIKSHTTPSRGSRATESKVPRLREKQEKRVRATFVSRCDECKVAKEMIGARGTIRCARWSCGGGEEVLARSSVSRRSSSRRNARSRGDSVANEARMKSEFAREEPPGPSIASHTVFAYDTLRNDRPSSSRSSVSASLEQQKRSRVTFPFSTGGRVPGANYAGGND